MTDEEKIKSIYTKYRKAVRREYFRRQGALKRLQRMAEAGDLRPALKRGEDIARSSGVAPLQLGGEAPLRADLPPLTGLPVCHAEQAAHDLECLKAMPERDDEIKGQTDTLSSSSGADMTDGHDGTHQGR